MLKVDKAYDMLEELCQAADKTGMKTIKHYSVIIDCLKRLDLTALILLAQDTSIDLSDRQLLKHVNFAVFEDSKLLYALDALNSRTKK